MQIPGNAFLAGLGFLQQPQKHAAVGHAQQVNTGLRPGANDAGRPGAEGQAEAVRKSAKTARAQPVQPRAQGSGGDPASGLARIQNLEQAVRALADQGRLPPRGSLIDLRA